MRGFMLSIRSGLVYYRVPCEYVAEVGVPSTGVVVVVVVVVDGSEY